MKYILLTFIIIEVSAIAACLLYAIGFHLAHRRESAERMKVLDQPFRR